MKSLSALQNKSNRERGRQLKKVIFTIVAVLFLLAGCTGNEDEESMHREKAPMKVLTEDADSLIIYFSRSGNTENLVKMICNEMNADMLELTLSNPYPEDYDKTVERANEERDSGDFPEINTDIPDLS